MPRLSLKQLLKINSKTVGNFKVLLQVTNKQQLYLCFMTLKQ